MDYPCGKRQVPCMSWLVPKLETFGEIEIVSNDTRQKLLATSPKGIDRLLKEEKRKLSLKKRKSTKPGSLLKNRISVRILNQIISWRAASRTMGYARYDADNNVKILNEIYDVLRLYVNFFQPTAKLACKERYGARVKKSYDTPKTPCMRLLESPDIDDDVKVQLQNCFDELNPAALKRGINRLLGKLERAYLKKKTNLGQQDKELVFI